MKPKVRIPLVLTEGFRFFFLFSSLFAFLSIGAWLLVLYAEDGFLSFLMPRLAMDATLWHGHEMVFGYATGVVAGFFLTAVPNWTKTEPARAAYICTVGGLWAIGRIALWYSADLPAWLVAVCDLIFLPPLLLRLMYSLRNNPQPHNIIFTSLLAVLVATNLMCHLEWLGVTEDTAGLGIRTGLFVIGMMIFVLGGRVAPAFTRNALRRKGVDEAYMPYTNPMANKLALISTALFTLSIVFQPPAWIIGVLALVAAGANIWRVSGWQTKRTLHDPILWNMHLGYVMLILGLATYGISMLMEWPSEISALHVMGIGAIGGMTLAVMARATLGHTGRPLKLNKALVVTYIVICLAAFVRGFLPDVMVESYDVWILTSGALWMSGFAIFLVVYLPIFLQPRVK